ncbi:hypothetical protein J5N97_019424 [Dioscorea zingiberensis]|uniref:HSF-type DNA-binding domain-containing protein n=1 Tax=Dioscorea zingiberensis TaxID=325984 RepID=A0A9D5CEQ6_9LILI|nr:hypothetical protein J5N97_019424 [Dioscorea zingiberensis]
MEGSHGCSASSSPAPFLIKTYDMVDDPESDDVVSWSSSNSSFVVWKPLEFARDLLPKYFKHNNFSSFVRQLNTYGFKKVDPDQWEFANEEFVRGQRHLLKNIHRRKPIHSRLQQSSSVHLTEAEKLELEEEIERLKHDKGNLLFELQKYTQQQHGMERQMQSLEERLQIVEQRQRDLISFLGKTVQRPGFLSDIFYQSDLHHKKRRSPKLDYFFEDGMMEENQIVAFQTCSMEKQDTGPMQVFDIEPLDKIESSLSSLEAFFRTVSEASGGDMWYDDRIPSQPSGLVLTEMHASSEETDVNMRPLSPKLFPSSPCLGDIHSSPELVESTSNVGSPGFPAIESHKDTRNKISEIDVNLEPTVHEDHSFTDRANGTPPAQTAGVNDVFWEQFLTETPGSSETQEVQSKRQDADTDRSLGKKTEKATIWWNKKNVDHLTEQMGHLAPTEKT